MFFYFSPHYAVIHACYGHSNFSKSLDPVGHLSYEHQEGAESQGLEQMVARLEGAISSIQRSNNQLLDPNISRDRLCSPCNPEPDKLWKKRYLIKWHAMNSRLKPEDLWELSLYIYNRKKNGWVSTYCAFHPNELQLTIFAEFTHIRCNFVRVENSDSLNCR